MEELILWILNQFNMGYSVESIKAKLEVLLPLAKYNRYTAETVIKTMLEAYDDAE